MMKTRKMMAFIGFFGAVGAAWLASTSPVRACSEVALGYSVSPVEGPLLDVPVDGVIVLEGSYSFYDVAWDPELPEVVMTAPDGVRVEGELVRVPISASLSFGVGVTHRRASELLVFRPSTLLEADTTYVVSVQGPEPLARFFSFEVLTSGNEHPGPAAGLSVPPATATRTNVSRDLHLDCVIEPLPSGPCRTCRVDDYVPVTDVAIELPKHEEGLDLRDPYVIYELRTDAPAVMWEATLWGGRLDDRSVGHVYFTEPASSYCVRVVARSLIDGTTVQGPEQCVEAASIRTDVEPEREGETGVSPAGGCSASGGGASGFALAVMALAVRRRR